MYFFCESTGNLGGNQEMRLRTKWLISLVNEIEEEEV